MKKKIFTSAAGCADGFDGAALPIAQALQLISQDLKPVRGWEKVAIRNALGRVLAQEVNSPIQVPAHTNAAMDGYTLRSQDLPENEPRRLKILGTAFAGRPYKGRIRAGECVQVMTGAAIPPGADTVVMQEQVEHSAGHIRIFPGQRPGQHIRRAGEDIALGEQVLKPGRRLTPADIGLLSSLGLVEIKVWQRLRVAFFSTGDELRSIGETLRPGQIYDSNRYTIYAMLQRLNIDIIDMGIVPDQIEALKETLITAADGADVIISSGGVSVGAADYVKEALENLGGIRFWKIALKPGRPLAFGHIKEAIFFGLPGNPVSAMVTFYQCVQPALLQIMGQSPSTPLTFTVPCRSRLQKQPGRTEYQRGILERDEDGLLGVKTTGRQGSGILTSMSAANCFIILPRDSGDIAPGTQVQVQPFADLI